jgi:stress response protein SCP2
MAVNLRKGQGVSLKKSENDLSLVTIGLGWDVAEEYTIVRKVVERNKPKVLGLFGGGTEQVIIEEKELVEYDLDVVAFLCGQDGKIADLGTVTENGKPTLRDGDIVFFNSLRHKSGNVWLTGDNRTGEGDGDDEEIIVRLNDLSDEYNKIVFIVQIYDATNRGQNFGSVKNAYIRAVDGKGKELLRFDLSGGEAFKLYRSLLFAELVREDGGWKFNAIGSPSETETFVDYIRSYI